MLETKTVNGILYQKCTKCTEWKVATVEFFSLCKSGKNGIRGKCLTCRKSYLSEYYKKYYIENKEKLNEQCRAYNNKKKSPKIYCKLPPQFKKYKPYDIKEKEKQRIYYEKNKEKVINRKRKYRESHKEEYRIYFKRNRIKRKMKSAAIPATLTLKQWEEIKQYFNNSCCYCGEEKPLNQEHFIPLSKNGEYAHTNIVCACSSCNSSKGAKSFFEWYPTHKGYSKKREQKILKFLSYTGSIQQLNFLLQCM